MKEGPNTPMDRYRARRHQAGYRQKSLWVHEVSFRVGRQAAELDGAGTAQPPQDVADRLSWRLGYIERRTEMERNEGEASP